MTNNPHNTFLPRNRQAAQHAMQALLMPVTRAGAAFLLSLLLLFTAAAVAQNLKFRGNGEFKILQLTDLHVQYGNPKSDSALNCIDRLIAAERPDLVLLTGDVVFSAPADKTLQLVLNRLTRHGVPFAYLFGNHDCEHDMPLHTLYDMAQKAPHSIMPPRGGVESPDYVLPIRSHNGRRTAALLYCLDSHSMSQRPDVKGYAWLTEEQVQWYRQQNRQFTAANGGTPLPALAFFHIPVPEFSQACKDEDAVLIGTRMEASCPPSINTGMFSAMKFGGDVMAIFCGHDHDNDYTLCYQGMVLGYGRYSGGNTVYNHLPTGGRIIVLKENRRSFDTYVRELSGNVLNRSTYPDSYVKDDWEKR